MENPESTNSSPVNKKWHSFTSTQVTLLVAIISLFGAIITVSIQGCENRKLEQLKFESELILKIIETDDIDQNKKNLQFLVDAGLLEGREEKLRTVLESDSFNVRLPNNVNHYNNFFGGRVIDVNGNPIEKVLILILSERNVSAETNQYGHFYYPFVPNELINKDVTVLLKKEGYQTKKINIKLLSRGFEFTLEKK